MDNQYSTHAGEQDQNGSGEARSNGDKAAEGMSELRGAAEKSKRMMQGGIEAATRHAREVSERMSSTLGFSGEDAERLAGQAKQNMEAVSRCNTVMTHAYQDATQHFMKMGQSQWQRNLDGLNKLAQAKSVHEFSTIQSDLIREGVEQMVQDSRSLAENTLKAMDEAGKSFRS